MKKVRFVTGSCVLAVAFVALMAVAVPPRAVAQDSISKQLINDPNDSWQVYGTPSVKRVKDKSVQGGAALRVTIAAAGAAPWDAAAQVPIKGKISKGDHILAAAWLKATTTSGAPAALGMRIQIDSPPYDALVDKPQTVQGGWQLYSMETIAPRDCDAGGCTLVVHLASAAQVVDLGPAFVLRMDAPAAK